MENLCLLPRNDAALARKAAAVSDWKDPELQGFIDALIQCGEESMGVGIAAPQVGRSLRVFIMASKPGARYPDAPAMEPMALINPEILKLHGEVIKDWEGCLSVPGFRGQVPRYTHVDVRYQDRFGETHARTYSGFLARLFQHEFDHLEGVLYPARMDKNDPLLTLEEFAAATGLNVPR